MLTPEQRLAVRRRLAEQYSENNNDDPDAFDESRAAADDADPAAVEAAENWSIFDDGTLWTVEGGDSAVEVTIVAEDRDVAWALRAAMADELDTEEVTFANAKLAEAPDPATVFEDDARGGVLAAMIVAIASHNGDFAEEAFEPAPPTKRARKV
jgi:hypothetical protein